MKWLEKSIAVLSPQTAAARAQARLSLEAMQSFDAAKRRRRNDDWSVTDFSANEDMRWDLEYIRQRGRDLVRNSEYACKAINSLSGNMIGSGIKPRIGGDHAEKIRDLWDRFSDQCDFEGDTDFGGIQMLAARGMIEAGESLVIRRAAPARSNLVIPVQYQVLESDHIDGRKNESSTSSGGRIIQGIELDKIGRRVAYWLFERHPGERGYSKQVSKRIPADQVLHLFEKKRAGQLRDVSWFAPVMLRLRDLGDYEDAELMAKKIQACFGIAIKQLGDDTQGPLEIKTDRAGTPYREEKLKPGMTARLNPGEDIELITPPHAPGSSEYTTRQLRAIAAGIGITYEQLTGDFSQVNYSSFRGAMLDFQQRMNALRYHLWKPRFCAPVWRDFSRLASEFHGIDIPAAVRWTPPRYQSVDPMKDYKATLIACRAGLKSLQQAIGEFGEDPLSIIDEIEEMNALLDAKGIALDSDPRKRTMSGAVASDERNTADFG